MRPGDDLLWARSGRGTIQEKDYHWISGAPGKEAGSRWGVLNIAFPCGFIPADHELISGTIRKIEENMTPGGRRFTLG